PLVAPRSGNVAYNFGFDLSAGADFKEPPLKAFSGEEDKGSLAIVRFDRFYELGESKSAVKPRKVLSLNAIRIPGKDTEARGVSAVVHTPDGRQEKPAVTDFGDGSHLRFADTDLSGVYRVAVTVAGKTEEYLFAVNVPARNDDRVSTECDLKRTNRQELAK